MLVVVVGAGKSHLRVADVQPDMVVVALHVHFTPHLALLFAKAITVWVAWVAIFGYWGRLGRRRLIRLRLDDCDVWLWQEGVVELIDVVVVHVALNPSATVSSSLHSVVNRAGELLAKLHEQDGRAREDTLEEDDDHDGEENGQDSDDERAWLLLRLVAQVGYDDFERGYEALLHF